MQKEKTKILRSTLIDIVNTHESVITYKPTSDYGDVNCDINTLYEILIKGFVDGTIPILASLPGTKELKYEILNDVVTIYYVTGSLDKIFESRVYNKCQPPKIFINNDILFNCIPSHLSCDDCKINRKKIRDIFKGTLLELLYDESLTDCDPVLYPFLYDFLILAGCIVNDKKENPRLTNLLISDIKPYLYKENVFVLDLMINSYGFCFISDSNWYLNNTTLISDRFITLLLLKNDFDTSIIDTILETFDIELDFITNMFISKFNIEKSTFAYHTIPNVMDVLYNCLKYVYDKTEQCQRYEFIKRICNSFIEKITTSIWRWKLLDIILLIQDTDIIVPILYDEEPSDGYYVGKYFGHTKKITYDVLDNKTFIFNSNISTVEENKRIPEIYEAIKNNTHPYLSLKQRYFSLDTPPSSLLFHIYCDTINTKK